MKNKEAFIDFLTHCNQYPIKQLHLADASLLANSASSDFSRIYIVFDDCCFVITSNIPIENEDETIGEFNIERIERSPVVDDSIYITLPHEGDSIEFVTEMINEHGYFDGIELKTESFYIFIFAFEQDLTVTATNSEYLKHELYVHQFGCADCHYDEEYVRLFY